VVGLARNICLARHPVDEGTTAPVMPMINIAAKATVRATATATATTLTITEVVAAVAATRIDHAKVHLGHSTGVFHL
jgi:hypothetical protein